MFITPNDPMLDSALAFDGVKEPPGYPEETFRKAGRRAGSVRLAGLRRVFETPTGPLTALDGIDLGIEPGEIFGIIGRSGAGKSTLIRSINRLDRPTGGSVLVDGEDITNLPESALPAVRQRIGMVFQHFNLLSAKTVAENVALPLKIAGVARRHREAPVARLLDLVGLADKRDVYPVQLSGGQKQRVGIARALVTDPDILLCDEATSALDPETMLSILDLLKDINRRLNLTIILITHEMTVIREICDRVAVLEAGRVVESGPVWEVLGEPRAEATRRLLRSTALELPEFLTARLKSKPAPDRDALIRLHYAGPRAFDPVLADLALELGVRASVVHGAVDTIQDHPIGVLVVAIPPDAPVPLEETLLFLTRKVARVEMLGHVTRR